MSEHYYVIRWETGMKDYPYIYYVDTHHKHDDTGITVARTAFMLDARMFTEYKSAKKVHDMLQDHLSSVQLYKVTNNDLEEAKKEMFKAKLSGRYIG